VVNRTDEKSINIEVDYPIIDLLELYEVKGNELHLLEKTGDLMSYTTRNVKTTEFIFEVDLPQNTLRTFALKANTKEQLILPISISGVKVMAESEWIKNLVIGISFGVLLVMFLYNFLLYLFIKDKSYLYYILYILFIGLTQASLLGYTYQYLWPNWPNFNNQSILLLPSLAGIFAILFLRNFMLTSTHLPKLDKAILAGIGLYGLAITAALLNSRDIGYKLVDISAIYSSLFALIISVVLSIRGVRAAKFYLIAWSTFILGIVVFVLRNFGIIPFSNFSNYTMLFGTSIEATFLSLALADRINILKKEKEDSQYQAIQALKENERLILYQNTELEHKVNQRTLDLQTAYKNLQDTQTQLVSAEKMASLGQLTAGIAHEINNPINFVVSSITPLRRDIADMKELLDKYEQITPKSELIPALIEIEKLRKEIDIDFVKDEIELLLKGINDGASRTAEIVKSLRTFSRVDESDLKRADLNEGLASTLVILTQQWSGKIELVRNFGNISMIECYPGKLNQVFMNLLNNAIYAVQAHPEPSHKGKIIVSTFEEDGHIVISVKDNGLGMTEEVRSKIFEPFFTTKDVGKGTGLGLSITYSIIEKHNGSIEVISAPGEGAEFIIRLPIVDEFVIQKSDE
jgi:signal transduction histidine kinase